MAMLSAAASTIPRLRLATQPRPKLPSYRSHWLRTLSSATHVTPAAAAGAGSLEPPDLPRLAKAARISLSPQEVGQPAAFCSSLCEASVALRKKETDTDCLLAFSVPARQAEEFEPKIRQVVDCECRDAIVEAIPSYDDPYIKVPRVLNKE
uniref:Glutamyl-tRNA(Gln) amidotransferase subunit C, chloroplastic/mitochondrial n=1 Tax=Setaria italica TaxID=4555 RepID=K4AJM6_SETIT